MNIKTKYTLILSLCLGIIYTVIYVYITRVSSEQLQKKTIHSIELTAQQLTSKAEGKQYIVEEIVQNTALAIQYFNPKPAEVLQLLESVLKGNEGEIYGMCVATPNQQAHYVWMENGRIKSKNLALDSHYNYREQAWFKVPTSTGKEQWSSPYHDRFGGEVLMTTYSLPIFDAQGQLAFVITGDLSLVWLNSLINNKTINDSYSTAFISDIRSNTFIAHPNKEYVLKTRVESVYGLPQYRVSPFSSGLKSANILRESTDLKDKQYLILVAFKNLKWQLGMAFSERQVLAPIARQTQLITAAFGLGLVLMILGIFFTSNSITQPLSRLTAVIAKMGTGDLSAEIPYQKRRDEIGQLAQSFAGMTQRIQQHIKTIFETTAAKERLEKELELGHEIQQGLLPNHWPLHCAFPHYELHSFLASAREVGGDMYDYFAIDSQNICLFIGDVSGKGVAAALYMASLRAYLRAHTPFNSCPARLLERLNGELALNNHHCMFATVFCAYVNLQTGSMTYSSAGHEAPYILGPQAEPQLLPVAKAPALGIVEAAQYTNAHFQFSATATTLFVYTDGLLDAADSSGNFYGKGRLQAQLARDFRAKTLAPQLKTAVLSFTNPKELFDDITFLIFEFTNTPAND
ncbi:SpoIIE family protein phosphatase [Flavobacterium sp. JP2137]|uniref:SpoIIE family protein phosphatase n=1 Tax=Flavobacterium sp. JP2137 TaxID=3414510 RepID=UPI003D30097B